MAWYTGTFATTNAGELLTVLDTELVLNSHWTIHDAAAGTNCKVYECNDASENCLFFVKVDDNYTGYAVIELWEGWNDSTHVGTGTSLTVFASTYTMRIYRPAGGWHLSVLDHRFVMVDNLGSGYYCGQPVRYDTSKNIVLFIGMSTGGGSYNNLGYLQQGASGGGRFLFDDGGGSALVNFDNKDSPGLKNTYAKGIDGSYRVIESHILNDTTGLVVGVLDGVMTLGTVANGLSRFDVVSVDGVDWEATNGNYSTKYWALVRKS